MVDLEAWFYMFEILGTIFLKSMNAVLRGGTER